jgi:O-antigen/teichoic acid export membrane protein
MRGLTSSLLASFLAKGWSAFLSLAFVPVYIKFLGVEAYGLIGAFLTLQAVIFLLDLGLGPALTRELARSARTDAPVGDPRDLLRTLEVIYWSMALFIAIVIWWAAPLFATRWLQAGGLTNEQVVLAIRMAGISLALQWSTNLYSGGLAGLHKQVLLAVLTAGGGTLRVVMTVLALWLIAPTLQAFFLAQALANCVLSGATALAVWRQLRNGGLGRAVFRPALVRAIMGFATGMTAITFTAVVLTQLDKAVLSKTLPLESFGYYAVASTLASGLYIFVSPMFGVLFPRFAALVARDDQAGLRRLYHGSCQLMSMIVLPIAATLSLFSSEVLLLWTGNATIASRSHLILSLLVVGNALNGLMNMPYAMQLAHGWTQLTLYSNLIAICICAPLLFVLSLKVGAVGGAIVWVMLMIGVMLSGLMLTHRRFALGSSWRWYIRDVGYPALAAFLVVGLARVFLPPMARGVGEALLFVFLTLLAGGAALLTLPLVRQGLARSMLHASSAG